MIARRTRRMSSSLLPLNMTPATTSMVPWRVTGGIGPGPRGGACGPSVTGAPRGVKRKALTLAGFRAAYPYCARVARLFGRPTPQHRTLRPGRARAVQVIVPPHKEHSVNKQEMVEAVAK